jgi:hypothetical protein
MNSTQKNDPIPLNNEVLMNGLLQIYNSHVEIMLDNIASEYNLSASALKYLLQKNVPEKKINKLLKMNSVWLGKQIRVNAREEENQDLIIVENILIILNMAELMIMKNIRTMTNLFIVR